ncbi:hypothetical protein [Streptomyces sp. NBC_01304]|nr:hypothetical protein OG430_13895 [Streptomyces sp. NBC_01304]
MPPALRKRPEPSASAAATPAHRSSTHLPPATVAPQPWVGTRLKTAVSQ